MPAAAPPDALRICASNPWFASLPVLERRRLLAAALSNRIASFSGMQPNPEFYLMGRVPRDKKPA